MSIPESFLQLRADDPKRRVRVASALYVTSFIYLKLQQPEAGLQACERALEIIAATESDQPVVAELHGRLQRRQLQGLL